MIEKSGPYKVEVILHQIFFEPFDWKSPAAEPFDKLMLCKSFPY